MMRTAILLIILLCVATGGEAKKIKKSFTIEKSKTHMSGKSSQPKMEGVMINMADTIFTVRDTEGELSMEAADLRRKNESGIVKELRKVSFSGFDKEPNSSNESFHISNPGRFDLKGARVRIDYLDMNGRMLHSREVTLKCDVPAGETRRLDIDSWDRQHTYYYYLGNVPRKVATPFQVSITPLAFWIYPAEASF